MAVMLLEFATKQKIISHCFSCTSGEGGKQPLDCFLFVLQRKPIESCFCFLLKYSQEKILSWRMGKQITQNPIFTSF